MIGTELGKGSQQHRVRLGAPARRLRTRRRGGCPQQHLRHAGGGRALVPRRPGGLLRKRRVGGRVQVGDCARVEVQDARPAAAQVEGQPARVPRVQLHTERGLSAQSGQGSPTQERAAAGNCWHHPALSKWSQPQRPQP